MSPASRAVATSAARSSLLPSMDQISAFAAPSTCMGPPLTESPGWCQVYERATCGGAQQGKHDRMPCRSGDRQVLERMAGTGASASGAGTASARTATRFNERPAITPTGRRHGFYEGCPPSRDLVGHGQPDSKIRLSGAGNDCDAFRSREPAIRRAIGSLQLTPEHAARQHRRAAIGGLCGRFRVAMHRCSTWLHFTTHDSSRAAPGVDVCWPGLWY